jgi:hypothetical protein
VLARRRGVLARRRGVLARRRGVLARRREPGRSGSLVRAVTVVVTLLLIVGGIMSIGRSVV